MPRRSPSHTDPSAQVEGHAAKFRILPVSDPEVEAHAMKVRFAPPGDPEVEAHAAGRELDVARLTLDLVDGGTVVLEPAGNDAYTVVSGWPEVEGHRIKWGAPAPGPQARR